MIKTRIKISYLPGLEPYTGYEESFYSCYDLYEKPPLINIIRTQEVWEDNRNIGADNVAIQSSKQQRFELKFASTESQDISLIQRAGIVEIFPENEDSYLAYNVTISPNYVRDVNTYIYTLQFSKHNERNYIDYLASNYVKAWGDLSGSNYVNSINFISRNTAYTQRSALVNDTIATLDFNFKFEINSETSQISVGDKFYAITNTNQVRASLADQDYRCEVVYIDTDYIYFKYTTIPIQTFSETEIEITGEPVGEHIHATPTANEFTGKIYTFLRPKLYTAFDPGESFEQFPGIQEYSNLKMYRVYRVLLFLKPEEAYLYEMLMMCKPEDVYFSNIDNQGNESKYYPVTMNNLTVIQEDNSLKDLIKYEMLITYNNKPINVFRQNY